MNQEQFWNEFSKLPPTAQRLIEDFMQFLQSKYQVSVEDKKSQLTDSNAIDNDGFIGMWGDRADMSDSSEFVRALRVSEWSATRE